MVQKYPKVDIKFSGLVWNYSKLDILKSGVYTHITKVGPTKTIGLDKKYLIEGFD